MGNKCRFAERVVSTAQRLANVASSRKNPAAWSCCLWWRRGALQRKRSNRNSLLEEEHVSTHTIWERVHFFPCMHCMHDARQPR